MSAEEKLTKFVRRVTVPSAGYTKIALMQFNVAGGGSLLRNYELSSDYGYDASKVAEVVAELMATAQEDADGRTGVTSYRLKAFKGVTQGESSGPFRLRSQDAEIDTDALGDTEPATKDGALAQQMRHNEVLMRLLVQQQEVSSRQSTEIIARLTDREKHYADKHWEVTLQREELANEKDEREIARLKEMSKERRLDEALKTFKPLVPALMSKLKGMPVDAKANLNVESLKAILSDITPSDMEKIANILGPRSLALAEMYMDANKEDDSHEQSSETKPHS